MVPWYGPFHQILKDMGVAVKIACFSHREIDECSVHPGKCSYDTISCNFSPGKVGLSDFKDTRKEGMKEGSLSRICEGLIPNIEPSFLGFANIEGPP